MNDATIHSELTEYIGFWNDTLADKFDRYREILMNGLSYHSRVPLEKLTLEPGSNVVDVGCGWGDTAIELAHRSGPSGSVLGLDCVEQFLVTARQSARTAGDFFLSPRNRLKRASEPEQIRIHAEEDI